MAQFLALPVEYVPLLSLKADRDRNVRCNDLRMCVTADMPDAIYAQRGWPPFHKWDDGR